MRLDKSTVLPGSLLLLACGLLSGDVALADSCPPAPLVASAQYFAALGATSAAIGDFTNDGKADVVVTTDAGIMVFPGNGDGTLGAPILSPPNPTGSIVAGYFDGDSNLDIAVADSQSLYVLLGNGDGTFQDPVAYGNGFDIQATLATGDFNGDTHVDLVETDGSGRALWIYLGHGDGTFEDPAPIDVTGQPVDVAVADFNGDGHADLAVALGSFDDTAFLVLLGNGDGTFAPPVAIPTGMQVTSIAAADLDGDGHVDVVVGEPTGVAIFRGNGDGSFQAAATFPTTGPSVRQVLALDLDGDGLLDIAVLQSAAVLEFLQSASHAFAPGPAVLAIGGRLAVGDLNGDGLPDFGLPSYSPGTITVVLSTPGSYLAARSIATDLEPQFLVAGDFDGDGQADLFVSGPSNGADSAVVLNEGGAFRIAWTASLGSILSAAVADLDGDGHMDLALGSTGGVSIQFGHGDGTFSQGPIFNPSGSVAVADFNGDGIPDIATGSVGNGGVGELNVFLGQGGGAFQPIDPVEFPNVVTSLASGDFDGDGVPDLVLTFGPYDGSNTIGVLLGNGDGTFRNGGSFLSGLDPFAVSVGDFNEDGNLDVVAANGGSTNVSLLLGDGAGGFAPVRLINVAGVPLGLAVADIDGDAHLDLAIANSAAFPGGTSASVLLGDGAGGFLAPIVYPTAARPQAIAAGAFGPAGRTGIAIAADNDWVVDVFLNGALSPVSVSGGGTAIVSTRTVFSAAATSAHTLTYQWRKGGVPLVDGGAISGTTTARLIIDPVSFDDAGSYDVIVTDTCGSVSSNPVALSVEFADVPASSPFHADILTIATEGITSGCGGGNYCPASLVRRDQMAVFLLKSEHGSSYLPPACTGVFSDVACPSAFADWIEQLAAEAVTSGCGGGAFCPSSSVTRAQMAVFLLKTRDGSAYIPPPAVGIFGDVPVGSFGADFIEALYAAAITGGCQTSPLLYCPDNAVLRQQMAAFLVRTFTP